METAPPDDELARLRSEVAEWRRRAEDAEAALASDQLDAQVEPVEPAGPDARPLQGRSLRARWRRYVDSIN